MVDKPISRRMGADQSARAESPRCTNGGKCEECRKGEHLRRDHRAVEAQRAARRWALLAGVFVFALIAGVSPAFGVQLEAKPGSSWETTHPADTTGPGVSDLWPVDREIRRHVFGREGFRAAEGFRPRLYSVEWTPFEHLQPEGCCLYAAAATITGLEGEDAREYGHLLGAISLAVPTAEKLYDRKPVAVHTLVHEYLHAIRPKAGEGLVDAVALDLTRSFYRANGQPASRAHLGLLHFSYWGGSGTISSGWVRNVSAARTGEHPDSRAAKRYRRAWLLSDSPGPASRSRGGQIPPGPDAPPAAGPEKGGPR